MKLKLLLCLHTAILLFSSNIYSIHTIYISGLPVRKNKNWFKQSKVLYDILKQEIERDEDNSIELFPKKEYRDSVIREAKSTNDKERCASTKYLTQKELESRFKDLDSLLDDLVILIMKRVRELRDDFEELDEGGGKIHLMAHGRGGELLSMLKESEYRDVIRGYVVFDGGSDVISDSNSVETSGVQARGVQARGVEVLSKDERALGDNGFVGLALRSDGNLILNIDLAEIFGVSSSHKGEIIAWATAVIGLIGGLLALL